MKNIIESPFSDGKAALNIVSKKMTFRKEEFDVYDYYYICEVTKKEFTTNEATELTLKQLYNQYREKHNIPFPEQIRELREQYELSAQKMSEVLGFGENVYRNYEKGEIPSKSNSKTLNLISQPENFVILAEESCIFNQSDLDNFKKIAHELNENLQKEFIKKYLRNYTDEIDQFTGYSMRSFKKLSNMIIHFLNENERLFTTRLNKNLFYSDFISYKYSGNSISGYTYCALPNGPVLDNYNLLFAELCREGYIESKEQKIGEIEIEKFTPVKGFDKSLFSENELEILKYVSDFLKFKKTDEIIEMSHKEQGWIDNISSKSGISYQKYAPLLNL